MAISIFWFRQDLRLSDNPGLLEALKLGQVLPIYIYDDTCPGEYQLGSVSKLWLYYSLKSLQKSLKNNLNLYQGDPKKILHQLIKRYNVTHVFWSIAYEPWSIWQQNSVKEMLNELKVFCQGYHSSYLWNPENILKEEGGYYKVFSAYKRKLGVFPPRKALGKPKNLTFFKDQNNKITLESFNFISQLSWQKKIISQWEVGEEAAKKKLLRFVHDDLSNYQKARDYPSEEHTSKLSPHLHFGEISPVQIWEAVHSINFPQIPLKDIEHFLNEIIWREFSCYLMFHFQDLHKENFQRKFNLFPWRKNERFLKAWQTGNTGYPIVDAGMRQLWQTGYMHNRVRMIVASFLVKNLMIPWDQGMDWFWDCLVDADLANNSASWQWVAGCGADAAPYFRVFNPITQGEKFDNKGYYTRKFVPELKLLPDKYLFKPWQAPQAILDRAGVILGKNYPKPIVDLKISREEALLAYKALKT